MAAGRDPLTPIAAAALIDRFRADVLAGLARRPRAIPARWCHDRRGAALFAAVTELPDHPARAEAAILARIGDALAERTGEGRAVIAFGSDASAKLPLGALAPAAYVPIDLSDASPRAIPLPGAVAALPKLGFCPGATIGSLAPAAAVDLLRRIRTALGEGAQLLIGMDRITAAGRLIAAHEDPDGVTAAFTLNLLGRINRELAGSIPLDAFAHEARWNEAAACVELHLVATRPVSFVVAGLPFAFERDESIHIANSHKYGPRDARLLLRAGGWTPSAEWLDDEGLAAVILAEARPAEVAP